MNMHQRGNTHNLIYTNMQIHPKLLRHATTCFPTLLLSGANYTYHYHQPWAKRGKPTT
jgi:hypothetical protein